MLHYEMIDKYGKFEENDDHSECHHREELCSLKILMVRVPRFACPGDARKWFKITNPEAPPDELNDPDLWEHYAVQIKFLCKACKDSEGNQRTFNVTIDKNGNTATVRHGYYRLTLKKCVDKAKKRRSYNDIRALFDSMPSTSYECPLQGGRRWALDFFSLLKE
ncbi:hypothetical protein DdX_15371 [Ditylenchus destructor]|uniref:Uncharacterized protein n=1 Tax=Ditylenchus destructor TaxID=166010 RepID=A0AAD4R136_9BILA|nr:hypothetical protein DdX_15371 [Ditylenchus destructor]